MFFHKMYKIPISYSLFRQTEYSVCQFLNAPLRQTAFSDQIIPTLQRNSSDLKQQFVRNKKKHICEGTFVLEPLSFSYGSL